MRQGPQTTLPMKSTLRIDGALTLAVLAILITGCFLVLQPFLTAIVWAAILCATMWPLHLRLTAWFRGRQGLAAMAMVLLIALTMLAPFVIVGVTIAENADRVGDTIRALIENGPPDPPSWVVESAYRRRIRRRRPGRGSRTTRRAFWSRRATTSSRPERC